MKKKPIHSYICHFCAKMARGRGPQTDAVAHHEYCSRCGVYGLLYDPGDYDWPEGKPVVYGCIGGDVP